MYTHKNMYIYEPIYIHTYKYTHIHINIKSIMDRSSVYELVAKT